LYKLIAQYRYAERALFPTRFWYVTATHQFCLIAFSLQILCYNANILFQIFFENLPIDTVYAGRCFPIELRNATA